MTMMTMMMTTAPPSGGFGNQRPHFFFFHSVPFFYLFACVLAHSLSFIVNSEREFLFSIFFHCIPGSFFLLSRSYFLLFWRFCKKSLWIISFHIMLLSFLLLHHLSTFWGLWRNWGLWQFADTDWHRSSLNELGWLPVRFLSSLERPVNEWVEWQRLQKDRKGEGEIGTEKETVLETETATR